MAHSFTNISMLSALLTRRRYASVARGVATRGGAGSSNLVKKGTGEEAGRTKEVSWVPDLKPENSKEIDMVDGALLF